MNSANDIKIMLACRLLLWTVEPELAERFLTGVTVGKLVRTDVAEFVLRQLTGNDLPGKTPLPTY